MRYITKEDNSVQIFGFLEINDDKTTHTETTTAELQPISRQRDHQAKENVYNLNVNRITLPAGTEQ